MQRPLILALVISLGGLAQADPEPRATVKAINANHNSYTFYNYKKPAKAAPTPSPAAEPSVAAPTPLSAPAPAPAAAPVYQPAYAPSVNPAAASSTFVYSVSPGAAYYSPGYYPYPTPYPGACVYPTPYTGFPGGGLYQGISISGYYNNGNGLTITAGYPPAGYCYPGPGFAPGMGPGYGPCGPGFSNNLTPQRFNPLPGAHPYSIQRPGCR